MTTRIISCLVGDSYKLSFATISGKGDNSRCWRDFCCDGTVAVGDLLAES